MEQFIQSFVETDWLGAIIKIASATILGYLIGVERELHGKVVGTRTISLIAIGSALYVLMSPTIAGGDNSRIIAQVVSGIGFIGAGTIIFRKAENIVSGLTTAAGLWVTAAIGLACGGGMYVLAIASTFMVLLGLEAFNFFLHKMDKKRDEKHS